VSTCDGSSPEVNGRCTIVLLYGCTFKLCREICHSFNIFLLKKQPSNIFHNCTYFFLNGDPIWKDRALGGFFEEIAPTRRRSGDMRSVPDPKMWQFEGELLLMVPTLNLDSCGSCLMHIHWSLGDRDSAGRLVHPLFVLLFIAADGVSATQNSPSYAAAHWVDANLIEGHGALRGQRRTDVSQEQCAVCIKAMSHRILIHSITHVTALNWVQYFDLLWIFCTTNCATTQRAHGP